MLYDNIINIIDIPLLNNLFSEPILSQISILTSLPFVKCPCNRKTATIKDKVIL